MAKHSSYVSSWAAVVVTGAAVVVAVVGAAIMVAAMGAAVVEAAVVGIPHESHGEEVKAVVALGAGQSASEEEIVLFCKENLAAYKYPRVVEFLPELPKGPTGKILKRELR